MLANPQPRTRPVEYGSPPEADRIGKIGQQLGDGARLLPPHDEESILGRAPLDRWIGIAADFGGRQRTPPPAHPVLGAQKRPEHCRDDEHRENQRFKPQTSIVVGQSAHSTPTWPRKVVKLSGGARLSSAPVAGRAKRPPPNQQARGQQQ